MKNFCLKSIGKVESCYPDKFGTPRQPGLVKQSWAKIHLYQEWQPEQALQGLEDFSYLWVLFVFHKNKKDFENEGRYHAKVHPPRLGGKKIGVFATRSPHRPNPIGLSLVKIEKIESDGVVVSGIDLVNGTPVLDIKPYLPDVEAITEVKSGWTEKIPEQNLKTQIEVSWTEEQLQIVNEWQLRLGQRGLTISIRELIEETLRLDPRPTVYKGYEGKTSPYREDHAVRIFDGDIHFKFTEPNKISVQHLLFDEP